MADRHAACEAATRLMMSAERCPAVRSRWRHGRDILQQYRSQGHLQDARHNLK
jgi:hypothetical protein